MKHWRSQDFVLRGSENRGAVGAEFEYAGRGMGRPTRGSGERRKLPQRGSGAEPRPKTDFGAF